MKFLVFLHMGLISLSMYSADIPVKKVVLSDEVLDQLNEVEKIYRGFLDKGMIPSVAASAACKWQDEHYPTILYPIKEKDYKKKEEGSGRKKVHKKEDK